MTASISDPNVSVTTLSSTPTGSFTLTANDIAGFDANFPNANNQVFWSEVQPGEALVERWDHRIGFSYPNSYVGSGILTATLDIGGDSVSWSATVDFGSGTRHFDATSAQRLSSSVPEPATAGLVGLGLLGLAVAGRRTRRRF